MWPAIQQPLARFRELEAQLADPSVVVDHLRYSAAAKEHGKLSKLIRPYLEFEQLTGDVQHAEALAAEADADMREYALEELAGLRKRADDLKSKIEDLLLVEPGEDYDSIIMEIRAGTGGDEAALFAGDLYSMYTHYARDRGWAVEDISFSAGEQGGFKEVVFGVSGDDVYRDLRYEIGGHRVQRVPKTETQGRIHTSAATVAVLAEPDQVDVEIGRASCRERVSECV